MFLPTIFLPFLCLITLGQINVSAQSDDPPSKTAQPTDPQLSMKPLRQAIDRSAHYLSRNCDVTGRFKYRIHLDPNVHFRPRYNVLRHAGSIYALAGYCHRSPDPKVHAAMLRAATFLRERCIRTIPGNARISAVWSTPEMTGQSAPRQAKLGGAGLGLVALLSVERVEPGFTSIEELRSLGRFLIFMQKDNGSFYSKYFPTEGGRNDQWQSRYYPGEAALGLLMLYEKDPAPQWLGAAGKALKHLAEEGRRQHPTFPDQWALLATQRLLPLCDRPEVPVRRSVLLDHARHICNDMMITQHVQADNPQLRGCYTRDGRTCPTATRLEGLLAATIFLPPTDRELRNRIENSVDQAIAFLVRCQVTEGPHAGAIPRACQGNHNATLKLNNQDVAQNRVAEVRIDYVQHALSAMLQYEAIHDAR